MRAKPASFFLALTLGLTWVDAFVASGPSSLSPSKLRNYHLMPSSLGGLFGQSNEDDVQEDPSMARKTRLSREQRNLKRFATGEELRNLRMDLQSLRHNLQWAEALKDETRIESLSKAIKNGENRDPDFMYRKSLRMINQAKTMETSSNEEREAFIEKWADIAEAARECLPQFNLEGLWVGNYGDHGTQVINITYSGDTLLATKVTGDRNVPRGETTFTVDLSPNNVSALPPIQLISDQRTGEFQRFSGRGQVSRKGFRDNRYVEGQMILFDNQFSFVWIPTKHHVLFSRPTPEVILRLMRDTLSQEDELENTRAHIARCYQMDLSTCIARQQDPSNFEPLRRITTQAELEEAEKRVKERNERNIFWQLHKWRRYIEKKVDNE